MRIVCFDLNTKCTGVFIVEEDNDGHILEIHSVSLIVDDFHVRDFTPYMESKKSIQTSPNSIKKHNAYVLKGETHVSLTEKAKRDREVRRLRNDHQIAVMSEKAGELLKMIKPNLVLIERNEMFRGIMTIEVLAKLNGTIIGECSLLKIPCEQHNVNEVRRPYNIPKLCMEFSKAHTPEFIAGRADVAKSAIRWYLENKYAAYGIKFTTDDESDAGLLYDNWKNNRKRKDEG